MITSIDVVLLMPQDVYNFADPDYGQDSSGFGGSSYQEQEASINISPISADDLRMVQHLDGVNRPRERRTSRRTLGILGLNNLGMNENSALGAMANSERRPRRNRGRDGLVGRILGTRGNAESGWDVYRICSLGVSTASKDCYLKICWIKNYTEKNLFKLNYSSIFLVS